MKQKIYRQSSSSQHFLLTLNGGKQYINMSTKKRMARSQCICEKILCNLWKTTLFKKMESQGIMLRKKGYKSIQLTLAQCRFELHRVHLHLGIFSIARTTALHSTTPQAESQDAEELWVQ